jgi:hypothetical protein
MILADFFPIEGPATSLQVPPYRLLGIGVQALI